MSTKVKFINANQSAFYFTVKTRVEQYFSENNISTHGNLSMWFKAGLFMSAFISLFLVILLVDMPGILQLGLCAILGMIGAFIGFNVCHDAIHGSFSNNSKINKVFSLVFDLLGASSYMWNICHNVVHHTYTNIAGHDEDIEVAAGLIRLNPQDPVTKIQRFQHYYSFFLYSFAMLIWAFKKDYKKFFQSKIGEHVTVHPKIEYFKLFFYKSIYYFLFIGLPLLVMPINFWEFLFGFMVYILAQGLVLGLVFQLAHVVEGTDFPVPNQDGNVLSAWAVHQMHTTANFSANSRLVAFLCGGLNRQIEHHLFPRICHIHYPAIGTIVESTALEFGLPYISNNTVFTALKSHYRMMKKLGKQSYDELNSNKVIIAT